MCRSFICKNCNKKFSSNSGLWYHAKKCGKKPGKVHKCPHCTYITSGPKCTLQNHIFSKHTKEKDRPYQCIYCERGFAQKSHLHKHMKKEHELEIPEKKDRNIIEYHIQVLNNNPISNKTKSRINLYKKNPIIKADKISDYIFWYTKKLKSSHLHYDSKKGYINFIGKTKSEL